VGSKWLLSIASILAGLTRVFQGLSQACSGSGLRRLSLDRLPSANSVEKLLKVDFLYVDVWVHHPLLTSRFVERCEVAF
jgi:hypothetical protein